MVQSKEQQLRRLITEIRMMESTIEALRQRLGFLTTAIAELKIAHISLNELKKSEEKNPLLVPIGGGVFVNTELGDISNVIVGVGANISAEMAFSDAIQDILTRLEDMEKAQGSVQQQLGQIITQLESHQAVAQRLSTEIQGAS